MGILKDVNIQVSRAKKYKSHIPPFYDRVVDLLTQRIDASSTGLETEEVPGAFRLAFRAPPYRGLSGYESQRTRSVSEWLLASRIEYGHRGNSLITVGKFNFLHKPLWFNTAYMLRVEQELSKNESLVASTLTR